MNELYASCALCPRACGVDRSKEEGFCRQGILPRLARAALHYGEEPCISGKSGSGAVFFSGCNLGCSFCQNYAITQDNFGAEISVRRLSEIFLELQSQGANNINLVTATPYVPSVIEALDLVKDKLTIPVVYNSSGYESLKTLKLLKGYVDIYLPDFKYYDNELAFEFSGVTNYKETATFAIDEMIRQVGEPQFTAEGMMTKGVIIRHLVLPRHRYDSINIMDAIARRWKGKCIVSLMRQFTPTPRCPEGLQRRVTSFEYGQVQRIMESDGLYVSYVQDRSSAKSFYIPSFDLTGVLKPAEPDSSQS